MTGTAEHWNDVYTRRDETDVSWFQAAPTTSLELLAEAGAAPEQPVVDVGAGASRLVDALLTCGFADLTALDVSDHGLARARRRLGADANRVRWVVADLLGWEPDRRYAVWHDRAVFHFLVDPADRLRYRERLRTALAPGGLVVVATFAADGPRQCSGLPAVGYSPEDLAREIDPALAVLATRREEHRTPGGAVQPFTWLVLRDPLGQGPGGGS